MRFEGVAARPQHPRAKSATALVPRPVPPLPLLPPMRSPHRTLATAAKAATALHPRRLPPLGRRRSPISRPRRRCCRSQLHAFATLVPIPPPPSLPRHRRQAPPPSPPRRKRPASPPSPPSPQPPKPSPPRSWSNLSAEPATTEPAVALATAAHSLAFPTTSEHAAGSGPHLSPPSQPIPQPPSSQLFVFHLRL